MKKLLILSLVMLALFASALAEAALPAPSPTADPAALPEAPTYVLNTNTKKFHYPDCPSVGKMAEKNREDSWLTRDELIALGYDPCGNCKP